MHESWNHVMYVNKKDRRVIAKRCEIRSTIATIPNKNIVVTEPKHESKIESTSVIKSPWHDWGIHVVMPDIHGVLRDQQSFELVMETTRLIAETKKLKSIIQLGDVIDCDQMSSHGRSHVSDNQASYESEIEWVKDSFWGPLKKYAPQAKQIQLIGNHENRINSYLIKNCNMPKDRAEQVYEAICIERHLMNAGVHVVPYATSIAGHRSFASQSEGYYHITPDLICIHGWSHSRNAAKEHLSKAEGKSIIFGHTHRFETLIDGLMISGGQRGAWSFGSLTMNNLSYNKGAPTSHTNGFGIVYVKDNVFKVDPINILCEGKRKLVILPQFGIELRN